MPVCAHGFLALNVHASVRDDELTAQRYNSIIQLRRERKLPAQHQIENAAFNHENIGTKEVFSAVGAHG